MSVAPQLTLARRIGAGSVLRTGREADYRSLALGDGEAYMVRHDLVGDSAGIPSPGRGRPLAGVAHVTDLQLADVQSPARFEFLNREFRDPRFAALVPVQRPQEALTSHAVDAMVRTLNRVAGGPATGRPIDLVVTSGDAIDNAQWNELVLFLALLDGGIVRVDSGGETFEGVQASAWPDDIFWRPDGGPEPDIFARDFGFPLVPGLLSRALKPFAAGGLDAPWLGCFGNHEALIQGVARITDELAKRLVGGRKPLALSAAIERDTASETFVTQPEAFFAAPSAKVTPDPLRRPLSRAEFVDGHFYAGARPHGHGFSADNRRDATAYYVYDTAAIRFIALDTASSLGGVDGSLDAAQFRWLERRLEEAQSSYQDRRGDTVCSDQEDRLVVIVSHHGPNTLTNAWPRGDHAGGSPVGGTAILELLHRFDNVVLWLNGHTHANAVTARTNPQGDGGFWEVTTCSLVDWPCQARLVEVVDAGKGMLAIVCTMLDHDSPVVPPGPADRRDLASLHRQLAANVPWAGFSWRGSGSPLDRNVVLPIRAPFTAARLPS